jgi:hypothetical protein
LSGVGDDGVEIVRLYEIGDGGSRVGRLHTPSDAFEIVDRYGKRFIGVPGYELADLRPLVSFTASA